MVVLKHKIVITNKKRPRGETNPSKRTVSSCTIQTRHALIFPTPTSFADRNIFFFFFCVAMLIVYGGGLKQAH
jgi:hypothetical protein